MRRAWTLLLAAALLFLGGEIALRLFGFGRGIRYRPQPRLGWEMVPSQHAFNVRGRVPVRVNSLGMRGPELTTPKPSGLMRILFLGDGTTLGNQLPEDATYPRVAASLLQKKLAGRQVEPVVAAVSGYQLEQEFELLKDRALGLSPDVVVLGFCWNDWAPTTMRGPDLGPEPTGEHVGSGGNLQALAYADFWDRFARLWARHRQSQAHARGEGLPSHDEDDVTWVHVQAMLDSTLAATRMVDGAFVLLVLPARITTHDPVGYAARTALLRQWAESARVICVDPAAELATSTTGPRSPYLDELQLSKGGQLIIATALANALSQPSDSRP